MKDRIDEIYAKILKLQKDVLGIRIDLPVTAKESQSALRYMEQYLSNALDHGVSACRHIEQEAPQLLALGHDETVVLSNDTIF
jgi:hypothetical protein